MIHHAVGRLAAVLIVMSPLLLGGSGPEPSADSDAVPAPRPGWAMPLRQPTVVRGFEAPAHEYAPGHRGVDLSAPDPAVVAPADGTIAFAGPVAGRPVVTIDHDDGLVTSLEPVETTLVPGTVVARGEPVGTAVAGGHVGEGGVHFGIRRDGEYINPLTMVTGIARAVLLPCC
ncbi:murein hydrolase activator EnvC family protein [Microbacterium arborescens]|uniref:murein hydrolase activator EnvC family protein n=1 Tax=Microbacterium arborescens TaxID=33883 RepID=UPI0025A27EAA|nr:peptidoglycan DD-metalloendopeptidase family protein [Microbacterium arborescens]WJM17167.1 peptidoglycan DD-metalloendopeptidase family protein [Microbacterium arborescens]